MSPLTEVYLWHSDANGNVTTYDKYDLNGLCTQKTLPNGQIIRIMYDNEGRVIQTTLAAADDGGEDISAYYEYDAAGRVTKYTDEEGNVSRERSAKLAEYYLSLGVEGLYVTGSSGECGGRASLRIQSLLRNTPALGLLV